MTFRNVVMLSALAVPAAALAQDDPYVYPDDYPEDVYLGDDEIDDDGGFDLVVRGNEDHLVTDMGVGVLIGGGSMNRLTDREANATSTGGTWHLRGVIGTRSFLAAEVAYLGAATPVAAGIDVVEEDAILMSNGGEANLRGQIPIPVGMDEDVMVAPFLTAGVGVQAHDLVRTDTDLTDDGAIGDDVTFHLPVAGGLAVATEGFIADARVSYRPAIANDRNVFGEPTAFDNALDELAVTGSIGVEF
jgi:hypothetical protein